MLVKFKGKQIVFYFTKNLSEIEIYIHLLNVEDLGKLQRKFTRIIKMKLLANGPGNPV